jgi:hypothetical protein
MRKFFLGVSSVVFAAVSVLSNTALAQTVNQVQVTGFTYGGSGCPQGTSVSGQISATNPGGRADLLILSFDSFRASQGKNISPSERQKSCNIAINLRIPQGYSFSLYRAQYAGYADLPVGMRGVHKITYSFPFSNTATFQTVLNGLYQSNYQRTDTLQSSALVWSPCSQLVPLNLRTSVALRGDRTPNASISVKQITGKVTQRYGIQWRKCTSDGS